MEFNPYLPLDPRGIRIEQDNRMEEQAIELGISDALYGCPGPRTFGSFMAKEAYRQSYFETATQLEESERKRNANLAQQEIFTEQRETQLNIQIAAITRNPLKVPEIDLTPTLGQKSLTEKLDAMSPYKLD